MLSSAAQNTMLLQKDSAESGERSVLTGSPTCPAICVIRHAAEKRESEYHILSWVQNVSKRNTYNHFFLYFINLATVFGDKISKLPYNSLNMIIIPWIDKFYCMSCKIGDHISMKETHCMECNHVENLMRCRVVEKYDCVLIRQVS